MIKNILRIEKKILVKAKDTFIVQRIYSIDLLLVKSFCRKITRIHAKMRIMISAKIQKLILFVLWTFAGFTLFSKGAKSLGPIDQNFIILFSGYVLGEVKARFVLWKSASRDPQPKDFLLVAVMMILGIGFSNLTMPPEIRSLLQIAVGFALIRGSTFRMRRWIEERKAINLK